MANENPLNTRLCDILVDAGIDAESEVRQPDGSRIDVQCRLGDHVVAIEAEHGFSAAKMREAISDADAKLRRNVADVAIALVYPEEYRTRRELEEGQVKVNIRVPGRQPRAAQAKWRTIKVAGLPGYVYQAPNELGSPEALAKKADVAINTAAAKFTDAQAKSIMAEMGEAARGTNIRGLMTDLLTAVMFHANLDSIRNQAKPATDARTNHEQPYSESWPPATVAECRQSGQVASSLYEAHNQWLAVDYKQILEWSCAIINALPNSPASNAAVDIIAEAALEIQRTAGNRHHDLVGITFCQSVETAKSDGSMYTTIPAATLLTGLLFHDAGIDWTDYEQVSCLRIADFACGTGTLLIAAANYILEHEQTGQREKVAQALLEQVLYGFDINNRAIFQTATGIGMIAPSVTFRNMHLYSLTLGNDPDDGNAKLGSLEMLEGLGQLSFNPRPVTGTRIDAQPAPIETGNFNMAIMNPPFTRGDIRHKQLDKETERRLRDREKQLYAGLPMDQSSNANGFFVLAEKYLDATNGRIAFVAPTAMATNPSAAATRRWLAERFHVKYIVVSYDPERIYQSGNTKIGEMLLVMERRSSDDPPPTTVVKLTTNPDTASDAAACASSIANGQTVAHEWGTVDYVDHTDIAAGNWNAVQFTSNELYRIASQNLWQSELRNQIIIDPMGRPIRNTQQCNADALNATPALYDHDVEHCNKMEVEPDCYVQPKPNQPNLINTLRKVNHLKLAERVRLTTVKNMACRTTVPAVGSAWASATTVPIEEVDDVMAEKAIVMVLNSTPGKLGMLLVRSNKVPSYPQFSKDGLERIPMPRLSALDPEQIAGLAVAYDELARKERLPLPQAHRCPVQIAIDEAVCRDLEFDADLCEQARHLLAQEPMVTGQRYQFPPDALRPAADQDGDFPPTFGLMIPAEETFAEAEAALGAGDYQHGANLAYQAAVQAVQEAAGQLGMPSETREELKAVVHKLDGFDPEEAWQAYLADPTTTIDLPLHSGYFIVAESFKEHAEMPIEVQRQDTERYWQPVEYARFLEPVRELIRSILGYKNREATT